MFTKTTHLHKRQTKFTVSLLLFLIMPPAFAIAADSTSTRINTSAKATMPISGIQADVLETNITYQSGTATSTKQVLVGNSVHTESTSTTNNNGECPYPSSGSGWVRSATQGWYSCDNNCEAAANWYHETCTWLRTVETPVYNNQTVTTPVYSITPLKVLVPKP